MSILYPFSDTSVQIMASPTKKHASYLLALFLAIFINNVQATCPTDCTCTSLNIFGTSSQLLHAKCSSLSGLASATLVDGIESIDCSGLGLTHINHQLAKLTNLIHVDLSHNNLTEMPRLGRRIRTLNLSYNRIESRKIHRIPSNVRHLNLAQNQLTEVPNRLLQLDHLESLDLTGNVIKCNCDTMHARNWLQTKRVEAKLICSSPAATKGLSWLEVEMSPLCHSPADDIWDIETNQMLGDEPVVENTSEENPSEEELGKDYLPFEQSHLFKRQLDALDADDIDDGSGSGSGDSEFHINATLRALETTTADDQEGSGSGVSLISSTSTPIEELHVITSTTTELYDDETVVKPFTLGIFKDATLFTIDTTTATTVTNEEEQLLARISSSHSSLPVKNDPLTIDEKTDNSESTYVLLVILTILLVGLIAFVVIRRKTARQRRDADAENANGKEMLAMNKERLGKPLNGNNGNSNGGEVVPLIGNRDNWDSHKAPGHGLTRDDQEELRKAQEPLLKKIEEPVENGHAPPVKPIRVSRPNSAVSNHSPIENNNNNELPPKADQPEIHINPNPSPEPTFAPISPKPARYSPVYSPETGRVKIRLAETPKPRTPMLVNRTRSNAGELITTPLRKPE